MIASPWARRLAAMETDGWELESAESRAAAHPDTFTIPSRSTRENLRVGQAAQLLFQIEATAHDGRKEVNCERMWVIVAGRVGEMYIGILDSQPTSIEAGQGFDEGIELAFRAEHIINIGNPPKEYLDARYGNRIRADAS